MALIYETHNFIVESNETPLVSREEGGNLRIISKDKHITDRTKLTPTQAIELIRLTMIVGEAYEKAMNKIGIKIVKVNYQDMGNWPYKQRKQPVLHYHIFGRVLGAKKQPFPESVFLPDRSTGFYEGCFPLNKDDVKEIRKQIDIVSRKEKYN